MGVIAGKDFNLYVIQAGSPVLLCYATDFTFDVTTEALETSDPTTYWQKFIGGYNGYGITVSGLTVYDATMNLVQLLQFQFNRTIIGWTGGTNIPGGVVYSGNILITGISQTSQFRDALRVDMSAIGTGPLVQALLPVTKPVYLANSLGVSLPGCPNPYPVAVIWYDGTVIGLANNADDVMSVFNSYAGNLYFTLTSNDTGCNFTMQVAWDAPFSPNFVIAEQSPEAAIMIGIGNGIISNDQINSDAITPLGA